MLETLKMPTLGLTMTEGTVDIWYKNEGDTVAVGEAVCQISSEKLTHDIEATVAGKLLKILVQVGETVPTQTDLGFVGEGEIPETDLPKTPAAEKTKVAAVETEVTSPAPKKVRERILVSPIARKLAAERGYDLAKITGTGPKGRITRQDVEKYQPVTKALSVIKESSEEGQDLTGMRKIIARRMHQSLQQTAQVTLHLKVDVTLLSEARQELLASTDDLTTKQALGWTPIIIKAVSQALTTYPEMNAWYGNGVHEMVEGIHLGIAMSMETGLVVPVLRDVAGLSLATIAQRLRKLITETQSGQLAGELYGGSTFSISNMGQTEVEYFTPILNSPEVGILGVGSLTKELALDSEGKVSEKEILPLSLTFDHQVIDGDPAGKFLQTIKANLEEPVKVLF